MFPPGSSLIRLSSDHEIKPFDCGDSDLNDFLLNDAKLYFQHLLTVTYILETSTQTIGFYSLLNDKISIDDAQGKANMDKQIRGQMPDGKNHLRSYPAMKIGRMGVSNDFKKHKIGTAFLDYIKQLFITNNRTGCRYITVDAYRQSLVFYEKNGFTYLTEGDKTHETRLMYFDLMRL